MEPTITATALPAFSCKPSTVKRTVYKTQRVVLFSIRLITLAGLFILITSYQSHRKELLLLENDLFVPALQNNLTDFFRKTPGDNSHATVNASLCAIPLIEDFYSGQDYRPVWTSNTNISGQAVALLGLLENAEAYGLDNSLFRIHEIRNEMESMKNGDRQHNYLTSRMNLELLLTDACFRFMVYLKMGYREFDSALFSLPAAGSLPPFLNIALTDDDFEKCILSVQPTFIEYRRLQQALVKFLNSTERADARISVS